MRSKILTVLVPLGMLLSLAACDETAATQESKSEQIPADHQAESEHGKAGHKEGDAHGEENAEGSVVKLTDAQIALAEIKTASAKRDNIQLPITLTGEVSLNQERLAHIVPRVTGYVREIQKPIGSVIRSGETLATIESRELSELKSAYLIARERATLAQNKFTREERLWKQKISSEQEYFDARQALAEANLELRTAEQNLLSVGFDPRALERDTTALYRVTTPIDGVIIDWSLVVGQKLNAEDPAFVVADLNSLWVLATVYTKDVGRVRVAQSAVVTTRSARGEQYPGKVTWVSDVIDEKTRTQKVRIEIENHERRLKPGMFVTVEVAADTKNGAIVVPPSAIQTQRGEAIVFLPLGNGQFARREVQIGIRTASAVEVLSGLSEGEPVVTDGSFTLRSELEKAGFEAGHGH